MKHKNCNTYKAISENIKEWGGILISTEYVNAHSKLMFKCPDCEASFTRTYTKMQSTKRPTCRECSVKNVAIERKELKPKTKCERCSCELSRNDARYCIKCWAELAIDARKTAHSMNGENNPSWKGGSLSWWKKSVLKTNKKECDCCGYNGVALVAHHLYSRSRFPEMSLDINNGVIMCANCHMEFHNKYGNDNTAHDYIEFKGVKNG